MYNKQKQFYNNTVSIKNSCNRLQITGLIRVALTIHDIAKRANVSSATVSRVLNNSGYVKKETKELVESVIKEFGYTPNALARGLSKKDTNTIGVVVPDIENPFFGEVIKGISLVAESHNLNILLCNTNESTEQEKKSLQMLKEQRIKGIVITPTSDTNEFNSEYLDLLESLGIPVILIDRDVKYSKFDGVFIDNIQGAVEGVQCLMKAGHQDIAIIAGPKTSKPGRDRLRGYRQAFAMAGLPVNEDYIVYGDFKLQSGYELTKKLLALPNPPTAIFSSNNMMTLGCIKCIREAGLTLGTDVSLVGFDAIEILDVLNIPITFIDRPTYEMGKIAMEMCWDRLNGTARTDMSQRITLMPKLIVRGSEQGKQ